MRSASIVALVAGLACAGAANASVLTYEFTATVTDIGDPNIYLWSWQGEGALPGTVVQSGQTVTGRFSYDNASTLTWTGSDYFTFSSENNQIAYTITSTGQQFQTTGRYRGIEIENGFGRHG